MSFGDWFKKSLNPGFTIHNVDSPESKVLTPQDLVKLNNNWVNICNHKVAQTIASIPLKLYYVNKTQKKIERTPHKSISTQQHNKLIDRLGLRKEMQVVEIEEHPFLDLMNNVNSEMNGKDFTELVSSYLGLIGNAYVEIITDGNNKPIELHPLVSEYVDIYATNKIDGKVTKYIYQFPEYKKEYIPEQIIAFKNLQPSNNIEGRGELSACLDAALRYNGYNVYETALSKNMGRPDGYWKSKGEKSLSEKEQEDLYKKIARRFGGLKNSGKPLIVGDFEYVSLGLTPRDMAFQQGRRYAQEEIAAAFGVPLPLISVQDVNLANAQEAGNFFYRYTVYPKMAKYCEKLNEQLLPMYGETGLYVWFEESYTQPDVNKYTNTIAALGAGIIDKNEARSQLGFEPVEEVEVEEATSEGDVI